MISSRLVSIGRALARSRSLFAVFLVIVGSTCRDATGPELNPSLSAANAALTVSPSTATLHVGASLTLTVAYNGNRPAAWVSSDTTVATVVPLENRTARVYGHRPGSTTITATVGRDAGSATITVTPAPVASVTLAPDSASVQRLDTVQFVATARDANGNVLAGRPTTWLSTDTAIASVSSTGRAAARTRGAASIIATVEDRADTARLVVRQAQLTVSSISAPDTVASGDWFWLRYSVQNLWDSPGADSVIVRIGYRDSTGTVIAALRRALPRVAGGATVQDSALMRISGAPGRAVSVVAYVDCPDGTGGTDSTYLATCLASPALAGSISEGDETDNTRSATVHLGLPNLLILAVPPSSSPDTVFTRGSVTRRYRLHNQGSAAGSGFEYIVGLRNTTTQSFVTAVGLTYSGLLGTLRDDTVAVTLNIPALDPSHVYQFWAATDCPSQGNPAARLYECFHQPGSGAVPELNELDNRSVYAPFVVASNIARIVAPDSILLTGIGDTARLTPIAYDRANVPVTDASFTFESLDPGIVAAAAGLLRADAAGVARVVSRSEGYADTSRVYVVANPVPVVTSVTPASAQVIAAPPLVTVTGSGFVPVSVIRVNGTDRPTEFVSATELRTQIIADDVAKPGAFTIVVFNPPPTGGTSATYSVPIVSPTPVITAVSPASTPVRSGDSVIVLTVIGTGFIPQSKATFDGYNGPVTFISTTELRVRTPVYRLIYPHVAPIVVINPDPAQIPDNISNTFPFEVRAAPPVITSISPAQAPAGSAALRVRVTGSNFFLNSTGRFKDVDRPTTVIDANTLDVVLSDADLNDAGTFPITVFTDGPGAGTSNPVDFVLTGGELSMTLLPSTGAHTGGPGFTLTVHGTGFMQGAQVLWNGSPRPSQYVSSTRILGEISAADVATPGTAAVSVANPGGQTTPALTMTVRTAGTATATSTSRMTLHARDLVWDDATGRIYVSVPGSAPAYGNSIVAVDPLADTTTANVFVGSNPTRLARSDDGQFLYVGLDGANAVRRVALASLTPGLQWSLRTGEVAGQIRVLPGMPGSVAISGHDFRFSPSFIGVSIFDNGTRRSQISASHTGGSRIEFLESASVLYGYNNQHTGFEFFTIGVDALGARHLDATSNLISGFSTNIAGGAGRIYGSDGSVVDAERRVRVGSLTGSGSAVLVEPTTGRAYVLTTSGITVYDINTFKSLGTVGVSGVVFGDWGKFGGQRLVRWGSDGIAFLDDDELFIVRSPIFAP